MHKVYHRIEQIAGSVITVRADGVANGELAQVVGTLGVSLAQVIRLENDKVFLQVFSGSRGISTDGQVRFLGHKMDISFTEALLGRVFNGSGEPRDNGPALDENRIAIGGPSVNPAKRIIPRKMVRTGIPMIDVFNSLVESQKLPIFAAAGEPYNELLARIALQAEVDIIILGGMGLKHDDYLLVPRHARGERRALALDPVHPHGGRPDGGMPDGAGHRAGRGRAVRPAEQARAGAADGHDQLRRRAEGNRHHDGADSRRTAAIRATSIRQLASRYEKAVDFEGAGSITILAVTTMPGDDVTHPVPDNTGYITEGQFYLRNGRIEPFGSLSRLKQQVNGKTREDHRTVMNTMIQLYASYKETLEKQSMGFRMSAWDNKLLSYGERFEKEMMDLTRQHPARVGAGSGLADHGGMLRARGNGNFLEADRAILAEDVGEGRKE